MASGKLKVQTGGRGALKKALNESGWLSEEVVAAGHFRQGKHISMAAMLTGVALIELFRPRRSKLLPRQFVLAATADRLVAFKAVAVHSEDGSWHQATIKPGEKASFPRAEVSLTDLREGLAAESATLVVGTERIPLLQQVPKGDPNTDEFVELLSS